MPSADSVSPSTEVQTVDGENVGISVPTVWRPAALGGPGWFEACFVITPETARELYRKLGELQLDAVEVVTTNEPPSTTPPE